MPIESGEWLGRWRETGSRARDGVGSKESGETAGRMDPRGGLRSSAGSLAWVGSIRPCGTARGTPRTEEPSCPTVREFRPHCGSSPYSFSPTSDARATWWRQEPTKTRQRAGARPETSRGSSTKGNRLAFRPLVGVAPSDAARNPTSLGEGGIRGQKNGKPMHTRGESKHG